MVLNYFISTWSIFYLRAKYFKKSENIVSLTEIWFQSKDTNNIPQKLNIVS